MNGIENKTHCLTYCEIKYLWQEEVVKVPMTTWSATRAVNWMTEVNLEISMYSSAPFHHAVILAWFLFFFPLEMLRLQQTLEEIDWKVEMATVWSFMNWFVTKDWKKKGEKSKGWVVSRFLVVAREVGKRVGETDKRIDRQTETDCLPLSIH